MGGYLMQLQNFSVNDGEGIRTIVFLAGCPLRCPWCANPEGQTLQNPLTRWAETEEVLREIRRQSVFYRFSGGGVTFPCRTRRLRSPRRSSFAGGRGWLAIQGYLWYPTNKTGV